MTAASVIAADSQGVSTLQQPQAGGANAGALSVAAGGEADAGVTVTMQLVTGGGVGVAKYKYSYDLGATWKGMTLDTTWDGNGATSRTIVAGSGVASNVSEIVALDLDGDGIDDAAFVVAVTGPVYAQVRKLYRCDDLDTLNGWVEVFNFGGSYCRGAALAKTPAGNLVAAISTGTEDATPTVQAYLWSMTPAGEYLGGGPVLTIADGGDSNQRISAACLPSGVRMIAYTALVSGHSHIMLASLDTMGSWSTPVQVTAAGAVDYEAPSILVLPTGETVVFFQRMTATAKIEARSTTAADPGAAGTTWAAYGKTLWSGDTNQSTPSACIAPDGTVYVAMRHATSGKIQFSKLAPGGTTYSAVATALDETNPLGRPKLSVIGDKIALAYGDGTTFTPKVVQTLYEGDYVAGKEILATASPRILNGKLWVKWSGSQGSVGDYWTIESAFAADAGNALRYIRSRPAKSSTDDAAWWILLDAGANNVFAVDTVAMELSVATASFQMNSANVWTMPPVDESISFVMRTLAATTGYSLPGGGRISIVGGGLVARSLVGSRVQFATSGDIFEVADNDADEIYIDGEDLAGQAGALSLLAPKSWKAIAPARYRFARIYVPAQATPDGMFVLSAFMAGMATPCGEDDIVLVSGSQAIDARKYRNGQTIRSKQGAPTRLLSVVFSGPSAALKDEIVAQIEAHDSGVAPFGLIPDADDPNDFAVVAPTTPGVNASAVYQFTLPLEEVM
jgi:hypothetical protein